MGSLLIGLAVLFNGFAGLVARRAEIDEQNRRTLELAASVATARLDARIAQAATALSIATPQTELDRLAQALHRPVCSVAAGLVDCSEPGGGRLLDTTGQFVERAVAAAAGLAGDRARASGRPVAAVSGGSTEPAEAIVVAVDHGDRTLLAVMSLAAVDVVTESALSRSDGLHAAPLDADLVSDDASEATWFASVTAERPAGLGTGERWSTAVQVAIGGLLVGGAAVLFARDHRVLRRRATTDSLTGLLNRADFERRASRELARRARAGGGACLVVVDIDRFKSINDSVGHAAGDRVLQGVGRRLADAVRDGDLVGRWGGDEFLLLLRGVDDPAAVADRAVSIADRLRGVAEVEGRDLTASVGAAVFPGDGRDLATLVEVADRRMYTAKGSSRPPAEPARSGR